MTAIDPDALSRLQAALEARATEKSRTFWSKYLKGDAAFRGVPMAGVREAVHASWRASGPLWQRRAACVAFVNHGKHGDARIPGLMDLVFASAEALVREPERFAQTGVGWVLRECSLADRERVIAFGEQHVERLSREAMKSMVEKMPAEDKARLLAQHKAVASAAKRNTAR